LMTSCRAPKSYKTPKFAQVFTIASNRKVSEEYVYKVKLAHVHLCGGAGTDQLYRKGSRKKYMSKLLENYDPDVVLGDFQAMDENVLKKAGVLEEEQQKTREYVGKWSPSKWPVSGVSFAGFWSWRQETFDVLRKKKYVPVPMGNNTKTTLFDTGSDMIWVKKDAFAAPGPAVVVRDALKDKSGVDADASSKNVASDHAPVCAKLKPTEELRTERRGFSPRLAIRWET